MQFWMRIHVIKQLLVILELLIPLRSLVVSEIIPQGNQNYFCFEKLGLLSVLIQNHVCPLRDTSRQLGVCNGIIVMFIF